MSTTAMAANATVLGRLAAGLEAAAAYNRNDMTAPTVVLWADPERQWEPLLPRLRGLLPQLLTLGEHDPTNRTGPAIWLRCMMARTLTGEAYWPEEAIPILYLPGVSRAELRAVDECPVHLQPLAGIQYAGVFWMHTNGKDWTVASFFSSERGGLGLDVARDSATQEMLRTALVELADRQVEKLRGKQLSVDDLNRLMVPDPIEDLLRWLDDPKTTRGNWSKSRWKAFRSTCKKQYDFDPESDGELAGAARLGLREKEWSAVWQRFAKAPGLYPRLPERLRAARPQGVLPSAETWPQDNEQEENELRQTLLDLPGLPPRQLPTTLKEKEERHRPRRESVWASLGHNPLAQALRPLAELAETAQKPVGGATVQVMAEAYAAVGWKVDAAMLTALREVKRSEDVAAVQAAIRALYVPWLEETTTRFQQLGKEGLPAAGAGTEKAGPVRGRCILFADGLRFDVGQRLRAALESRGLAVEASWRWAALPPVTATAKPAVSPVADRLVGTADGEGFCPAIAGTEKKLTNDRFHQLLRERGYQVLKGEQTGADQSGLGWTEAGQINRTGHEMGWKLLHRLDEEVEALADRTARLLAAGWKEVQVITDHGWLLLPGGLPKTDLPNYLAQDRWGRCATLTPGARAEVPHCLWHWSKQVWVAVAPGITCFLAGKEYAHGSLSLQECLTPELLVRARRPAGPPATIRGVKWTGLRCKVQVEGDATGLRVDLRTKAGDPGSSLATVKDVGTDGTASLLVEDDSAEEVAVVVVLVTAGGEIVAQQPTTVGARS